VAVSRRRAAAAAMAIGLLASAAMMAPAHATVTYNGDFYVEFTDLRAPGGLGMEIKRVYNSFTGSKGIFGTGWGSLYEEYLKVQDDGSLLVHEYGGGAFNTFRPTTSSVRTTSEIIDDIMRASQAAGKFGSAADEKAYRTWLLSSSDNQEQAWEDLVSLGLIKQPVPPVGETFFSGRFGPEFVTRVPEGYQRERKLDGVPVSETFDLSGRLTRIWDADHNFIGLRYGPDGHLQQMFDNEGNTFVFVFNDDGFVTNIDDSKGDSVRYQYKDSDLVSATLNGSAERFAYDSDDNLISIAYPNRSSMQMSYNTDDLVSRVKDTDGTVTTYAYASTKTDTQRVDTVTTDTRAPNGTTHHVVSQYYYDAPAFYQDKSVETDDGAVTTTTYDPDGDPLTVATAQGTTQYTYDSLDRLVTKLLPSGTVVKWEYDPASGKISTITSQDKGSAAPFTERFGYDIRGNLTRASDTGGHDFSIGYDKYGRIAKVTGSGVALTFGYDQMSNVTTVDLGGVGSVRVSYLANDTIGGTQSSGGAAVLDKVRDTLTTVNGLLSDAGSGVITLPGAASS
jgi:YD repeat-containing protein